MSFSNLGGGSTRGIFWIASARVSGDKSRKFNGIVPSAGIPLQKLKKIRKKQEIFPYSVKSIN
jgi:hypothetical protein